MEIAFKRASLTDVDEVLALHYKYQIDSINEADKADGFITTAFTPAHLTRLIQEEEGLFIACVEDEIVAYAMAASWSFWLQWPLFEYMVNHLNDAECLNQVITVDNSYQYGPVCVDKSYRGSGVFEQIFNYSLAEMHKRFPIMVTFINKINPRSFAAHTGKTPLQVINEFEFNNNQYYKLACKTAT
ncbi:GNAT family acetyltransferase [Algibacillus agarilyticus]|uniref:GNAT family acetyltransferase n=1 Tax=Algibacillus agarilyticus TaxID=2234133 RepID=UPI0018E58D0F|nr:GNAT family acetyltransferase [Algibacillus agarilyticus]